MPENTVKQHMKVSAVELAGLLHKEPEYIGWIKPYIHRICTNAGSGKVHLVAETVKSSPHKPHVNIKFCA